MPGFSYKVEVLLDTDSFGKKLKYSCKCWRLDGYRLKTPKYEKSRPDMWCEATMLEESPGFPIDERRYFTSPRAIFQAARTELGKVSKDAKKLKWISPSRY
jgi:hypothetical protein